MELSLNKLAARQGLGGSLIQPQMASAYRPASLSAKPASVQPPLPVAPLGPTPPPLPGTPMGMAGPVGFNRRMPTSVAMPAIAGIKTLPGSSIGARPELSQPLNKRADVSMFPGAKVGATPKLTSEMATARYEQELGGGVRPGAAPPMNSVQAMRAARGIGGSVVPPGGGFQGAALQPYMRG